MSQPLKTEECAERVRAKIKDLLMNALQMIVAHEDRVTVDIIKGDQTTIFEVDIHPEDFGRLIGSKGRNIGGLRAVAFAISSVHGFRSIIRIKDEERFF